MNNQISCESSCLCGAIKIKANKISPKLSVCHCDMCRKWSGGPALALDWGIQYPGRCFPAVEGTENGDAVFQRSKA